MFFKVVVGPTCTSMRRMSVSCTFDQSVYDGISNVILANRMATGMIGLEARLEFCVCVRAHTSLPFFPFQAFVLSL